MNGVEIFQEVTIVCFNKTGFPVFVLPVLWSEGVLATVALFWGCRKGGHFGKHVEILLLKIVAFCQSEYRIACQ